MKDLLLYIARNLVDDPDAVSVTEIQGDQELTLELRVAPDDMGKVIGRQGRIAKEIRTVVRSYAQRTGANTRFKNYALTLVPGIKIVSDHHIRHVGIAIFVLIRSRKMLQGSRNARRLHSLYRRLDQIT